jgi:hypothetical protein
MNNSHELIDALTEIHFNLVTESDFIKKLNTTNQVLRTQEGVKMNILRQCKLVVIITKFSFLF